MKQLLCSFLLFALFFFPFKTTSAQVPGINFNSEDAFESYTLFEGANSSRTTYLIDNCGELVNGWELPDMLYHPKLLPNGNVLFISDLGESIQERDWDNKVVHNVNMPDDLYPTYEVVKLPNGNYLFVGRRPYSASQFDLLGWNNDWGSPIEVDVVVEIDVSTGEIVWEWNIIDHIVQEEFPNGTAYGIVADHPELLSAAALSTFDFKFNESFMINGMDYNPALDQIALSVRKMGEIIIIDHSTTTAEAAGSSGGRYGKGGDLLYRWGNPGNYQRAINGFEKVLYFQHNVSWITEGEHEGKLMVYNNNFTKSFTPGELPYSSVYVLDPPIDADGFYTLPADEPYAPLEPTITIDQVSSNTPFYSQYGSGVQMMPNGNLFITNAVTGQLIEVDPQGEVKWEYWVPFTFFVFRSTKYPLDYPAFADRVLTTDGKIIGDNSDYECGWINSTAEPSEHSVFQLRYEADRQAIVLKNGAGRPFDYVLYSLDGKRLTQGQSAQEELLLGVGAYAPGMYFINAKSREEEQWESMKFITY